jgi:hypothetical protein
MKDDSKKQPIHLIPTEVYIGIAGVFAFGAKKYGVNNWREDINVTSYGRTYSSLMRHAHAFWSGEDMDPDSKLLHLDHALSQLIILKMQTLETTNLEMDDRFKGNSKND